MMLKRRTKLRWTVLAIWLLLVGGGFALVVNYSVAAGAGNQNPITWPAGLPFQPAARGITLVLSLHPKCPCSVATVTEFAELMTRRNAGVTAYVLFIKPADESAGWERTALWEQASAIPGALVLTDIDANYSAKLGATTSGQLCAFDSDGRALFAGGITSSRGHLGDSIGSDAVREILCNRPPASTTAPVFGCPLASPPSESAAGSGR